MSELPETSGNRQVTIIREGSTRVIHLYHNVGEAFNDTIRWQPKQAVRLVSAYHWVPVYFGFGAGAYILGRLNATLPNGQQMLNLLEFWKSDAMNEQDPTKIFHPGLVFPPDTEFTFLWVQNISTNTAIAWFNFEYLEGMRFVAPPAQSCGVLERVLGVGGCDY